MDMDINAGSIGAAIEGAKDGLESKAKKGEEWFRNETVNLENLVSQGTEDAKRKMLDLARKYKVDNVTENMSLEEIRNKVKARLRNMR